MTGRIIRFLLKLFISTAIIGCASSAPPEVKEALLPEIDVVQVKENSDEALKLSRENKLDLEAINTKLIEVDNRLLLIGEELANLSAAKLEELENRIAILSEEFRFMEHDFKSTKNSKSGKEQNNQQFVPNTFTPNPKPIHGKKPDFIETESQEYKKASDLFYARKYEDAIIQFENVLKQYPKGNYADNCVYWKGESHFALGNYAKAVASFQTVSSYSGSEKADDAQFKSGLAYLRMGDKKQAVIEMEKLLSLHPDSEYVGRAKQELKKLN